MKKYRGGIRMFESFSLFHVIVLSLVPCKKFEGGGGDEYGLILGRVFYENYLEV